MVFFLCVITTICTYLDEKYVWHLKATSDISWIEACACVWEWGYLSIAQDILTSPRPSVFWTFLCVSFHFFFYQSPVFFWDWSIFFSCCYLCVYLCLVFEIEAIRLLVKRSLILCLQLNLVYLYLGFSLWISICLCLPWEWAIHLGAKIRVVSPPL